MEIHFIESVDSTQKRLKEACKNGELTPPVALYAARQSAGVGSRGNEWIGGEGNLFLSFALPLLELPKDLKVESASIYFASLLKDVLEESGSKVWLKWPNDFYVDEKKAGGMITNLLGNILVCGVGLNLVTAPKGFAKIDIEITPQEIVKKFLQKVEKKVAWKQVFRKYSVEFYKNKSFTTHIDLEKVSMKNAVLNEDGSITIDGKKVYSLR